MFRVVCNRVVSQVPTAALSTSAGCLSKVEMTHSEAFVETLSSYGVDTVFGIPGSAFLDAADMFETAGIRWITTAHEFSAATAADGYARSTGKVGVCIGQNGPGVSNLVSGVASAYWAHSPVVAITPEASASGMGHGGFQELDQVSMFESITGFQAHVNTPERIVELTARAFDYAAAENKPTQLNWPRDFVYGSAEYDIPTPRHLHHPSPAPQAVAAAVAALAGSSNPVIISGGGVGASHGGPESVAALAEELGIPVVTSYLHNDCFPASHELSAGTLGYLGSQGAMKTIADADLVIALGCRLNPFGTTPQYGMDYFPKDAAIIQVDLDSRRLGLTKPVAVPIQADAGATARAILAGVKAAEEGGETLRIKGTAEARVGAMKAHKAEWEATLAEMSVDAGDEPGKVLPRAALAAIRDALPGNAIVSTDVGNTTSVANGYLHFEAPRSFLAAMTFGCCGYAYGAALGAKHANPDRPVFALVGDGAWAMSGVNEVMTAVREEIPVTAVVAKNSLWRAEALNQDIWNDGRRVGTQLTPPSYAAIAEQMGAVGIEVTSAEDVGPALKEAARLQDQGKASVVEIVTSAPMEEPFRRDAMRFPQRMLSKYAHLSVDEE